MKKNIVLIGFMGVGKGKTARALAAMTGMYAVDCDDLIESLSNMKIKRIFQLHGEEHFRKLEQKTARWLEQSVQTTVISSGGGFYKVDNLRKIGKIVYLHAEFDVILERIRADANAEKKIRKRPLLQDFERARQLHAERTPLYRKLADLEIDVTGLGAEQIAEMICSDLDKKKGKK